MRYLTQSDVLDLARLACAGQEPAVRDAGLLTAALHRPRREVRGTEAYPDLFGKAAAMLESLVRDRPLAAGNRRTAWLCTVVFLDLNGVVMLDADQDRAYDLVNAVAAGRTEGTEPVAAGLRELYEHTM